MPLPWHEPVERQRAALAERLDSARAQRVHGPIVLYGGGVTYMYVSIDHA